MNYTDIHVPGVCIRSPILVLIPSRGRPCQLSDCLESLVTKSVGFADFMVLSGGESAIEAVNAVPHETLARYPIIGIVCDDVRMRTENWDSIVLNSFAGDVAMVHGWDGIQNERIATHPFFRSSIPLALGYVMPLELRHYYGDNFFRDLLAPLGLVRYLPELLMEHLHHSVSKSEHDATYQRSERHLDIDRAAYELYKSARLQIDRERIQRLFP